MQTAEYTSSFIHQNPVDLPPGGSLTRMLGFLPSSAWSPTTKFTVNYTRKSSTFPIPTTTYCWLKTKSYASRVAPLCVTLYQNDGIPVSLGYCKRCFYPKTGYRRPETRLVRNLSRRRLW